MDGATPFHRACLKGNVDCMKLLVAKGASLTETDDKGLTMESIVIGTSFYIYYLFLPCCFPSLTIFVAEYEDRGVEVQYSEGVKGLSPLLLATMSGSLPCVEFLLKKGAAPASEDFLNLSPIHAAVYGGNADTLRFLADKFDIPVTYNNEYFFFVLFY